MSLPLDIGDELVDRGKSALFLTYLARSAQKQAEREISRKKVQIALQQLRKLSTKNLHKHLDELEIHLREAIAREKAIQSTQKSEDTLHHGLKGRIVNLEKKLGKYLETQKQRQERIEQIEHKVKSHFQTKKERIGELRKHYFNLQKLLKRAKKEKHDKRKIGTIERRIGLLKARIIALK
jgi:chromosome segregation ATPase